MVVALKNVTGANGGSRREVARLFFPLQWTGGGGGEVPKASEALGAGLAAYGDAGGFGGD